jgi:signal transduction histidine kinase
MLKDGKYHLAASSKNSSANFIEHLLKNPRAPGQRGSATSRAATDKRTVHIPDTFADPDYTSGPLTVGKSRSVLSVPLMLDGIAVGVITMGRSAGPFTEKEIRLVTTFAAQAVIAVENTRLFEEVRERTRELAKTVEDLETASHHKSQFVANMSHELRTPLAAILGYAELMQEGFYDPLGQKSLDALTRIRSNGKHLLGLINTVLDIAKIESGQFTLNMADYAIESVIETVRSATESLAQNKKLLLKTDVAKSLPVGLGDEQRLTQVLLNLVGNAIKFTDAGEVRVSATTAITTLPSAWQILVPVFPQSTKPASSNSSIKLTARTPRPRAARVSVLPSPNRSSRCTAAVSGSNQCSARARPFKWSCLSVPSIGRELRNQVIQSHPAVAESCKDFRNDMEVCFMGPLRRGSC